MYLPTRCRTEDGYLVHQSLMTEVPYGRYTAARKGCGFIAVYNAVRYFARPYTEEQVHRFFHRQVFLGGVLGTTFFHLARGVYRFGLRVKGIRYRNLSGVEAGILWYHTGKTKHYVFLHRGEGENFRYYNTSYARQEMPFRDFYTNHVKKTPLLKLPIMFTLSLGKKK
ncbi:MAG: hypothetical protein IKV99_03665 [Oscillospiraceae bacterium]|nr:hypothetical protein [Oscillospiraceae bacterium]